MVPPEDDESDSFFLDKHHHQPIHSFIRKRVPINKHKTEVSMKRYSFCVAIIAGLIVACSLGCIKKEKIGILLLYVGMPEGSDLRFYTDFFGGSKDVFFPGWFAGGPFEGTDCYTVIH
jgi:hypothetical protein